jgi:SHS2 domain-containing protein
MEEKIKYVYIEHPSDVGFEAYGNTLEELFANAAIATYSFMTDVDEIEERPLQLDVRLAGRNDFYVRSRIAGHEKV